MAATAGEAAKFGISTDGVGGGGGLRRTLAVDDLETADMAAATADADHRLWGDLRDRGVLLRGMTLSAERLGIEGVSGLEGRLCKGASAPAHGIPNIDGVSNS